MNMSPATGTQTPEGPRSAVRKLFWIGLILLLFGKAPAVATAQVVESADAGRAFVWAGVSVSGATLQYGNRKMLGITGWVDSDTIRRFGIEAEGRWLEYHQTANVHAETYLAGVRYHFNTGQFQPYVKALGGLGEFNFAYNYAHGSYFVMAPGAGLDYRLSRRINLRTVDFEYQYWPQFTFGAMNSLSISSGVRFRVF